MEKTKTSSGKDKIFIIIIIFSTILLTIGVDRLCGIVNHSDFIFPPHESISWKTLEYNFTVFTNNIGFRDRDFTIHKAPGKYRILAVGDSFTFGWGVNIEKVWVKELEKRLNEKGFNVEIANLGLAGASSKNYLSIVKKYAPMLKPDLIIIAVLQGDDLVQLASSEEKHQKGMSYIISVVKKILKNIYPNFIRYRHLFIPTKINNAYETTDMAWRRQARKFVNGLSSHEKLRYENLSIEVKKQLINGKLSPTLIVQAVKSPLYFLSTLDLSKPEVKILIERMAKHFTEIKRIADINSSRVIVISVPESIYVSKSGYDSKQGLGFVLEKSMLTSDSPDKAIELASDRAMLKFFEVTGIFRERSKVGPPLFFNLDGHFNEEGHALYAESIEPIIIQQIKGLGKTGRDNLINENR